MEPQSCDELSTDTRCFGLFFFEAYGVQGSLDYQFFGNQTMQIDGNSEGFRLKSVLFGLVI